MSCHAPIKDVLSSNPEINDINISWPKSAWPKSSWLKSAGSLSLSSESSISSLTSYYTSLQDFSGDFGSDEIVLDRYAEKYCEKSMSSLTLEEVNLVAEDLLTTEQGK